ncbi:restriction endonuclease subunit S [Halomonas sp. C05BenzN]|uniref:restriction endonuclease subunit S n=1 Tax=Halomonas sp. C05BenzN TaxID=3411041 RepID=UPI003B960BE8
MTFSTIGDHVELQRGTTYKSALLDQPGPVLLGLGSIERDGGFRSDKLRTYGGPSAEKLLVRPGDLYVSLKDVTQSGDLLGAIARVPESVSVGRMTQDTVKLIFKSSIPKEYFYWMLRTPQYRQYCRSHATGTTNLGLSREDFFAFKIPCLDEKKRLLVNALESIEEKVKLNGRINQTLEQLAQAIFKSWFVDFEPVKAKAAALEAGGSEEDALLAAMQAISGKGEEELTRLQAERPEQYAELRATAKLFPSAMQESDSGEIPEGWECLALDQIAKYQNGLALQKFRPEDEDDYLPVVKIAQLKKGYADSEEKASPNIKPDCIIDNGDVVFSWSGSLMVDAWCGGKAALNQHLFKVTSENYPKWLYFHFTRHHLEEFQRIAADKAVTMGHIKREHLKRALCAIPDAKAIEKFGEALENILNKQIELRLEATTLSALRDTLLPKLISGELSLPNTVSQPVSRDVADATS